MTKSKSVARGWIPPPGVAVTNPIVRAVQRSPAAAPVHHVKNEREERKRERERRKKEREERERERWDA